MVSHLQEASGSITVYTRDGEERYDAVVCAVSPHRAADLFGHIDEMEDVVATLERLRYQPIYTAFLKFSESLHMPAPMLGVEGTAQWLFDRGAISNQPGVIAAVISAEGDHQRLTLEQVAERVRNDIDRLIGRLPPLAWHRVIAEKRATFECAVGVERPSTRTPLANLHLAGDYTASDYPATIEAAIRSGVAAAHQALHTG
jgi:predicted NAD/FAD-dependent oxidoreductase